MISIIIPTHNRPNKLKRLLESIKNQSFKPYEVLVIDDNSSLKEKNKIVCDDYNFVRYFLNESNKWAPYSRNKWIRESQYDILCFTDDDDIWNKQKLEKQYSLIKKSDYWMIYSWAEVKKENWEKLYEMSSEKEWCIKKDLLRKNFIPSSSVMIKKECFHKVWFFDESFPSCQDWEMWFRISKKYKIWVTKDFLITYYKHDWDSIWKSSKAFLWYIKFTRKYYKDFLKSGLLLPLVKYYLYWIKNYYKIWNGK